MDHGILELGCDGCGAVAALPAATLDLECGYCGTVVGRSTDATRLEGQARRRELAMTYAVIQLGTLLVSGVGTLISAAGSLLAVAFAVGLLWGLFEGIFWFIGY